MFQNTISYGDDVSLNNVSLNVPSGIFLSLGQRVPWMMRPLYDASLGLPVSWTMPPLDMYPQTKCPDPLGQKTDLTLERLGRPVEM
jgi:hypothetical protein